ncbi:MAG: iron-sulfur cluster-binding domain-containing protein [Bdellovibrionales bacterium]|nr:iron-sulfur cluster-binding domain-containing protein [Bdellovibrionales bacterium]
MKTVTGISFLFLRLMLYATLLTAAMVSNAQVSPEDHKKHHPPASADASSPEMPSGGPPKAGGMGGMDGMGEMMKNMGTVKKREFYPSLMTLRRLSEEVSLELEEKAHERMKVGASIMNQALIDLTNAAEGDDYPGMTEASGNLREGLAQFESGIATHQALAAGETPHSIGLTWFRKNLALEEGLEGTPTQRTFFGVTLFHLFVMGLLSIFFLAMILMYFFKMKRATKLLTWLQTGTKPTATTEKTPPAKGEETNKNENAGAPKTISQDRDKKSGAPSTSPVWKGKLKVATISQETPTVKTFKLVSENGNDLPFTYLAGQFMTLAAVIDGKPIKRAYTISSHPCEKKMLEITIKREENGLVSRYMHDVVHEGDLIDLEAASGKLTFSGVTGEGIVLIGGGVGITPLMSVLRCLISCGMKNEIHLLYACKSLEEFVFREELRQLRERNPNFKLLVAVDKLEGVFPGAFEGRLSKEKIEATVPRIAELRVHLCGPAPMMQAMREILAELKVPKEQIKEEAFGPTKPPGPKTPSDKGASTTPSAVPEAGALKKVLFRKSGKTVEIHEDETVLELSETSGVEIPFQCRVGTCGLCKVKLLSGDVTMEVQEALTEEDKQSKVILACQAKAQSDLEVEEP